MISNRSIRTAPVHFGCGDCGNTLVSVISSPRTIAAHPATFLSCPHCGSRWDLDGVGIPGRRR